MLYTLGSTLFVVSGVAGEVAAVGAAQGTPGAGSLPAGLIGWPNAVAANLCFMPAGIIQVGCLWGEGPPRRQARLPAARCTA